MRKVITQFTVALCALTLQSAAMATVYYDTGLSYTIGAVPGNDIYLGSIVNDDLWLDYNTANTPGTHLNLTAGGSVGWDIDAFGNSSITMNGGSVGYGLRAYGSGMIYLDGSNFAVTAGGVTTALTTGQSLSSYGALIEGDTIYYTGTITGALAEGETLDNTFRIYRTGDYAGSADIVVIPEPTTMALLALGGLAFVRRKQR